MNSTVLSVVLSIVGDVEAANAAAAPAVPAAPKSQLSFVIDQYFGAGGWMMYVILGVSVVGLTLFLLRSLNLYGLRRLNAKAFIARVVNLVENRRFREALDACEISSKHPLVGVMKAGLLRANRREKDVERAMENEMLGALTGLSKRVELMAVLANIATLLGLLGTIFGLIAAFSSVAAASAVERQEALAAGISQAMYTTAFGISVAVPLLFFHHLLSKRVEQIMVESEGGATALVVAISGVAGQKQVVQPEQPETPNDEVVGENSRRPAPMVG